jgi:hypothetical protein
VIPLYQGSKYELFRFKRYTDVRLVFAPEEQIAFFGGDPDNFEYPHYGFDVSILRAYENNQPAHISDYLTIDPGGPNEHELVFVSGYPGTTRRQLAVSELVYLRDRELPRLLATLYRRQVLLQSYIGHALENAYQALNEFAEVQNARKLCEGQLAGLLDPQLFGRLVNREIRLRSALGSDPRWLNTLDAYNRIAKAQTVIADNSLLYNVFEGGGDSGPIGFDSELFWIARTLLRAASERDKPDSERLPEFRDAAISSLEARLFSRAPIYEDLEQAKLLDSLTYLATQLGADTPLAQTVLRGKSPNELAAEVVRESKLKDIAIRRRLYEWGSAAVDAFCDPMLMLARSTDETARLARKIQDEQNAIKQEAYATIAMARCAQEESYSYPDANHTLRLAFGTVDGYEESGQHVPAFTQLGGLYKRADEQDGKPPFDLPLRWVEHREALNPQIPLDFVSTADCISGNSGSPVLDVAGKLVGIIFDGNRQSLISDFAYTDKQARAISVDSQAILEALAKMYDASPLVQELSNGAGNH